MTSPVVVKSKGQFWVVNTSPPGSGPGGAARTEYTICEGTFGQCSSLPNGGGVSGPYKTLTEAWNIWRAEPQNQNVSTLTQVEQDLSMAEHDITHTGNASPTGGFSAGNQGYSLPNPLSGLAAIAAALSKLTGYVSDLAMWRSIGWGLLGIVLVVLGIVLWLRKADMLPSAFPVPV